MFGGLLVYSVGNFYKNTKSTFIQFVSRIKVLFKLAYRKSYNVRRYSATCRVSSSDKF